MRRYTIALLFFMVLTAARTYGQKTLTYSALEAGANKKRTGDDKASFSRIFSAFAGVASADGQTILVQPTLYSIKSLFNPDVRKDEHYQHQGFSRNLQFNLGVSANEKSIFKYDSTRLGFTYALINNKKLKASQYQQLAQSAEWKDLSAVNEALTKYAGAHIGEAGELLATKLFEDGIKKEDIALLPADLLQVILNSLKLTTAEKANIPARMEAFEKVYEKTTEQLSKKTALLFGFNTVYDFDSDGWQDLNLSPVELYYYFCKGWEKSPALNARINYVWTKDTVAKSFLKRELFQTEAGVNFVIRENDEDEPVIEIKPAVVFEQITKGLYTDESKSSIDLLTTFRFRINEDFYLPLTVKYDTEESNFLGFLSIQLSL